jgi:hypothetical protein
VTLLEGALSIIMCSIRQRQLRVSVHRASLATASEDFPLRVRVYFSWRLQVPGGTSVCEGGIVTFVCFPPFACK